MIVDVHSHVMWYPDHVSEQFASEALASKLVKLEMSRRARPRRRRWTCTPTIRRRRRTGRPRSRRTGSMVFGLQARAAGVWVPNELIAEYVAQHPEQAHRLGVGRSQRA